MFTICIVSNVTSGNKSDIEIEGGNRNTTLVYQVIDLFLDSWMKKREHQDREI